MCQNRIEFWIKTVHNLYINNTWCKIGIVFMVLFLFEFLIRVWQKILSSFNTKVSQRRSNYLSINENLFVNQIMIVWVLCVLIRITIHFIKNVACLSFAPIVSQALKNWWWKVLCNEEWLLKEAQIAYLRDTNGWWLLMVSCTLFILW